MLNPQRICTRECALYDINLYGILIGAKSKSEIEVIVSELRLQPKLQALAHQRKLEKIDPFFTQDCEHTPKQ